MLVFARSGAGAEGSRLTLGPSFGEGAVGRLWGAR